MTRRPYGSVLAAVLSQIETYGPQTSLDLAKATNSAPKTITGMMWRISKGPDKLVYIKEYVYDQEGHRKFPRPLFALGNKPNAVKPKRDQLAVHRAWYARRNAKAKMNFVFNLGKQTNEIA